jgi:outer membrane immunogenic protein
MSPAVRHLVEAKMNKIVIASVAGVALSATAAWSADLPAQMPYKAGPMLAAPFSWTGLYLGVHVGGARGEWTNSETTGILPSGSNNASGVLGGLQVGYNYQFSNFVVGIEADYSLSDLRNTTALPIAFTDQANRITNMGTVTGRLGYAMDQWLIYAKGGFAWARERSEIIVPFVFDAEATQDRTGWTVGAGLEYGMGANWSAKVEYDYLDFGTKNYSETSPLLLAPISVDVQSRVHQVKVGLNYRFNLFGGSGY